MEVTVRDHWRWRSHTPVPRPNGLRRSVGAHAGRTRCDRSGHRRSAPGLPASPATTQPHALRVSASGAATGATARFRATGGGAHRMPAAQAPGFDAPLHALWRGRAPGVDARLRASWRERAPGLHARLRALRRERAPGVDVHLRASVPRGRPWRLAHKDGSCLGLPRLRLHRHGQSSRRCWSVCSPAPIFGSRRLHRIGHSRINAVRGVGPAIKIVARAAEAPARSQRRGGQLRLLHGCRDATSPGVGHAVQGQRLETLASHPAW